MPWLSTADQQEDGASESEALEKFGTATLWEHREHPTTATNCYLNM